ncbi:MAG: UbiX family flavin prenyltransferase [Gemmatimonadetes bacterium]|nr:UbiX family flavin prenyltransferase [Gemmatimonadota bacterium]MYG86537.1 UbiX family flavin prenyltransferase [Gemmatimonadota bacterium]MYJ89595.1 UbiX family flavin prenyltransferase [Gemmatimonadota bacterium]
MKHVIVAVTGASGGLYALRLLRALLAGGHRVSVVLSGFGRYVLREETGLGTGGDLQDGLADLYGDQVKKGTLAEFKIGDLAASIASGSVRTDGMVVIPCSMKTLSAIAHGTSSSLIERAADVTLKEARPLVLVPRETPLNVIHLRNLLAAAEAGARIVPAMPAFYQKPSSFDDLADFIAGRVLNLLGIEQNLFTPWDTPSGEGESAE